MHEVEVTLRVARRLESMTPREIDAVRRDCLRMVEKVARAIDRGEKHLSEKHENRLAARLRDNPRELQRLRAALGGSRGRKKKDPYIFTSMLGLIVRTWKIGGSRFGTRSRHSFGMLGGLRGERIVRSFLICRPARASSN
jgi:hypothetical protein